MPRNNARSKPGGNSEPWIYQGEVEAKVARTTQTLSRVNDRTKGSRIKPSKANVKGVRESSVPHMWVNLGLQKLSFPRKI